MSSSHPAPADRRASSSADADLAGIVLAREPPVRLGALMIEPPMRRVLHDDGQEEFLEPRVMQALVVLLRADGKIVSRDDLLTQCWRGVVVGEDAIIRVIGRLRRLSEGAGAGVFRLETITKVGYRLVVESSAAAAPAAPSAEPLLAVLAFDNLSGDADMAYFSDGVSEEVQQTVARAADLKVIGRTSSFHYRGADKNLRRVAAELKATHLLDGAVRRSGGRVRISAQLIECAGETTLWSDRFDRDLTDVFALQDEIAAAVAAALKVVLAPAPKAEPIDPAAYELFLKAGDLHAGNFTDPAAIVAAVGLLEQATCLAPRFARAWARLASARALLLRRHGADEPYGTARDKIAAAAQRALELDPGLVTVHPVLAELEPFGRWADREAAIGKALATAPNDAAALGSAARFCGHVGRHREALDLARRAFDLDPMNLNLANYYGIFLISTGHYLESQAIYDRLIVDWPDALSILANAILFTDAGRDRERLETLVQLAKARGLYKDAVRNVTRIARNLQAKDPRRLAAFLQYARDELAQTGNVREQLLGVLCEYGLTDEAYDLVERASYDFVTDPEKPRWDAAAWEMFSLYLRGNLIRDPRYPRLCAKLGLCDYWVETGKWPDCADAGLLPYDFKAECRRLATA
ncbi:MAG TPA: winged helix-turn-helix domain-containing protein [Caulobacteraceae bacterium]|jgi:TolB-like protein/tetratricopeptide (TPR) repeat protein|nr:winged helix-turn-helix domain-containing protein [Caulobacteraceae bacterium]